MKTSIFWGIWACGQLTVNWIIQETCGILLQRAIALLANCIILVSTLAYNSTLNIETKFSSYTSVYSQQTTRWCIPEDKILLSVSLYVGRLRFAFILICLIFFHFPEHSSLKSVLTISFPSCIDLYWSSTSPGFVRILQSIYHYYGIFFYPCIQHVSSTLYYLSFILVCREPKEKLGKAQPQKIAWSRPWLESCTYTSGAPFYLHLKLFLNPLTPLISA